MARDPGSLWKPLPESGRQGRRAKTMLVVHSTGTLASAAANWNYFARAEVVVEATFIIGLSPADPTIQCMDSDEVADANGAANGPAISVEVVGDGVGGFTAWQVSELIRIGRWARRVHGIPAQIIPSPAGAGFGWHVMFGAPGPWTTVRGKVCPGARRIAELKSLVFPAIFRNDSKGFLMALTDAEQAEALTLLRQISSRLAPIERYAADGKTVVQLALRQEVADIRTEQLRQQNAVVAGGIDGDALAEKLVGKLASRLAA